MLKTLPIIVSLGLGLTYCKTSKIRTPQGMMSGLVKPGQKIDLSQMLLAEAPEMTASQVASLELKKNSLDVSTVDVDGNTHIVMEVDAVNKEDAIPNYARFRVCLDANNRETCFYKKDTALFATDLTLPDKIKVGGRNVAVKGIIKVYAKACVLATQISQLKSEDANCGREELVFRLRQKNANPGNSDAIYRKLMERKQVELDMEKVVFDDLMEPATRFKKWYESRYTGDLQSGNEKERMLYVMAHNVKAQPQLMASVLSTRMSETLAGIGEEGQNEINKQGGASLFLTGSEEFPGLEKVEGITNNLACAAAGDDYVWKNETRSCYKKAEDDEVEFTIHKNWIKDQTIAGASIMFITGFAGSVWGAAELYKYRIRNETRALDFGLGDQSRFVTYVRGGADTRIALQAQVDRLYQLQPDGSMVKVRSDAKLNTLFEPKFTGTKGSAVYKDNIFELPDGKSFDPSARYDYDANTGSIKFKDTDTVVDDVFEVRKAGQSLEIDTKPMELDVDIKGKSSTLKAVGIAALVVVGVVGAVLFATGVLGLTEDGEIASWDKAVKDAEMKLAELKKKFYELDGEIFGLGI